MSIISYFAFISFFFFNDTATTEIYTLSLHDALPISFRIGEKVDDPLAMYANDICAVPANLAGIPAISVPGGLRSEEHTSELQSRQYLVCRLLLEKKKQQETSARVGAKTVSV